MIVIIYERRAWDVGQGKVFSVFDMNPKAAILTERPEASAFWIWLDPQPERLCIDVGAAIVKAKLDLVTGPSEPGRMGDTGIVDY